MATSSRAQFKARPHKWGWAFSFGGAGIVHPCSAQMPVVARFGDSIQLTADAACGHVPRRAMAAYGVMPVLFAAWGADESRIGGGGHAVPPSLSQIPIQAPDAMSQSRIMASASGLPFIP